MPVFVFIKELYVEIDDIEPGINILEEMLQIKESACLEQDINLPGCDLFEEPGDEIHVACGFAS